MKITFSPFALAAATALAITFIALEAEASNQSGPYSVEIIMNGVSQPVYSHGSQSFIAGSYGSAYQIRVNNQSGQRIEAVIAVDGRDVVTGQPVRPNSHRGYIITPFSSTSVDGFRSSTASVATFRFATIPESYAWRTGTSWGIGTIQVWVFEERPQIMRHGPMLPQGAPRSAAPGMGGRMSAESAPQAMGTEYGEQRWSPVSYTTFVRSSSRASAALGVRYNSYEMLAAAGIISPLPYSPVYYPCAGPYGCVPSGPFAPPPPPYGYIR